MRIFDETEVDGQRGQERRAYHPNLNGFVRQSIRKAQHSRPTRNRQRGNELTLDLLLVSPVGTQVRSRVEVPRLI
jgi:hypothetical protein